MKGEHGPECCTKSRNCGHVDDKFEVEHWKNWRLEIIATREAHNLRHQLELAQFLCYTVNTRRVSLEIANRVSSRYAITILSMRAQMSLAKCRKVCYEAKRNGRAPRRPGISSSHISFDHLRREPCTLPSPKGLRTRHRGLRNSLLPFIG